MRVRQGMANDLDTFGKRLKSLHMEGESTLQFAKRIGEADTTIGNYERGKRVPDADFLARLREQLGVDLNWLVLGDAHDEEGREGADADIALVDRFKLQVSAGDGSSDVAIPTTPMAFGSTWFRKHHLRPENVAVLEVKGESMEPLLYSGDPVLVDKRNTLPVSGKLYVVVRPDQVQIKNVLVTRRTITLVSENPNFPPEQIDWRGGIEPEFHRVRWFSHFFE